MKFIPGLSWQPVARSAESVATVAVNFTTDTQWTIFTQGNIDGEGAIDAPYCLVDNLANGVACTIYIGGTSGFIYTVPAYTRKLFRLPEPAQSIQIVGTSGNIVTLYFCTNPAYLIEDANLLAIQTAAQGKVKFPYNIYNAANQPQSASDQAATVELIPTAAPMNYNLFGVVANSVASGWITFIQNSGTQIASIVPSGGDTINTLFTAATPLQLYPGESGYLTSDGAQWFFQYATRRRATISTNLANLTQNANHEVKKLLFNGSVAQTYSLIAASSFGNGYRCTIENANTGGNFLTITPNGVDTIQGANANFLVPPGGLGELFIDNTGQWHWEGNFVAAGSFVNVASGVIPFPAGHSALLVEVTDIVPQNNAVNLYGVIQDNNADLGAVHVSNYNELSGGVLGNNSFSAVAQIQMTNNTFSNGGTPGHFRVEMLIDTTLKNPVIMWSGAFPDGGANANYRDSHGSGKGVCATKFTGLKLKMSSGNISFNYRVVAVT